MKSWTDAKKAKWRNSDSRQIKAEIELGHYTWVPPPPEPDEPDVPDEPETPEQPTEPDEHTHTYILYSVLSEENKNMSVEYKCECGDERTEYVKVEFAGEDGSGIVLVPDENGVIDFSDLEGKYMLIATDDTGEELMIYEINLAPNTPDEPAEPEQPDEPETPDHPGDKEQENGEQEEKKTSAAAVLLPILFVLGIGGVVTFIIIKKKKSNNKSENKKENQ